jgi:16S rRNA processing protein RimM
LIEAARDLIGMLKPQSKVHLGGGREVAIVRSIQPHGTQYLLILQGVTERGAAERYRGLEISVPGSDLPPLAAGTYYHWEIVGLEVVTEEGESLGRVTEILKTGANDVYVVQTPGSPEILIPAIEPVVREIDLGARMMRVHLLAGLRE